MNKFKLFFLLCCIYCIPIFAQDLVPYKTKTGWQLFDKTKNKLQPKVYQGAVPTKGGLIFLCVNGKWGAISRNGKTILSFKYDDLKRFRCGVLKAKDDEHFELFTASGKRIGANYYLDAAEYKNDSSLIVVKNSNSKYGIINFKGKTILKFNYDYAPEHFSPLLLKVGTEVDSRPVFGLLDEKFKVFIPVRYKEIFARPNGYFLCALPDNTFDLYNEKGQKTWHGSDEVFQVYEKYMLLRKEEQNGYFFLANKKIVWIPENVYARPTGNIIVCNSEKNADSFILDEFGNKIQISGVQLHTNGHSKYLKSSTRSEDSEEEEDDRRNSYLMFAESIADEVGKPVLKSKFQLIHSWTDSYCVVGRYEHNGKQYIMKYGVISLPKGDTVIELQYDDLILFKAGVALRKGKMWTLWDLKGKRTTQHEYTEVSKSKRLGEGMSEPLYYVKRVSGNYSNGAPISLCGYINESCQEVVPSVYARVEALRDRYSKLPPVKRFCAGEPFDESQYNGISALLDENFKPMTDFEYMYINFYWDSYIVYQGFDKVDDEVRGLSGIMDLNGKEIVKPLYDNIEQIRENGIIASRNGRMCLLNRAGKELLPLHFQRLTFLTNTLLKGELYDRETIIDSNGKQYFEPGWFQILESGYLDGTLLRVTATKKDNPALKEEFYVDLSGKEYREQ